MLFERIDVTNVRALPSVRLIAEPGINLVYGANGSGKTSFLEAVNLLSRARSFRTRKIQEMVRRGMEMMRVFAHVYTDDGEHVVSGVERSARETRIKYNGEAVRLMSNQVRNLPVLVLTPESQGLLTNSPKERRRWLDWLMFHVEPGYLSVWSGYQRALRHRNRLLRSGARERELSPWEEQMMDYARTIQSACVEALQLLQCRFKDEIQNILPGEVYVTYDGGWDTTLPLAEVLAESRAADQRCGFTRQGPHRADVTFGFNEQDAGGMLSRGQAKLYMVALLLAQTRIIAERTSRTPVILIDDVFAELDNDARARLAGRLAELEIQSFVTSTIDDMRDFCTGLFHVEHGRIDKQKMTETEI